MTPAALSIGTIANYMMYYSPQTTNRQIEVNVICVYLAQKL
jgi:hypothetical protein